LKPLHVVATCLLRDHKLVTKLAGLVNNPRVGRIDLVRRTPLSGVGNVRNLCPGGVWNANPALYEVFRCRELLRCAREGRPDVLVGIFLVFHGIQAALVGRATGIPYVLSLIGDDVQIYLRNRWLAPLLAWSVRGAAAVTVMGPSSGKVVEHLGCDPARIFELQNHQDHRRFSPPPVDAPRRYDVVFAGDFIPRKGLESLLRALAAVSRTRPARAALVGDGPLLGRLRRTASGLGLEGSVDFLGRRGDIEEVFKASRVLVMPSAVEGLPAAAVEAMLCGLPVVLTDVGDVRALFRHGENALLVAHGDQPALDKALSDVLTDQALYARLRAGALATRERFVADWGLDGQVRAWDRVLDTALRPR